MTQCRLCESTNAIINLFDDDPNKVQSDKWISYVLIATGIHIKQDDVVSKMLCTRCYKFVEEAYQYRMRIQQNVQKKNAAASTTNPHIQAVPTNTLHTSVAQLHKEHPSLILPIKISRCDVAPVITLNKEDVIDWYAQRLERARRNRALAIANSQLVNHAVTEQTSNTPCLSNNPVQHVDAGKGINVVPRPKVKNRKRLSSDDTSDEVIPAKKKRIYFNKNGITAAEKLELPRTLPCNSNEQKLLLASSLGLAPNGTLDTSINSGDRAQAPITSQKQSSVTETNVRPAWTVPRLIDAGKTIAGLKEAGTEMTLLSGANAKSSFSSSSSATNNILQPVQKRPKNMPRQRIANSATTLASGYNKSQTTANGYAPGVRLVSKPPTATITSGSFISTNLQGDKEVNLTYAATTPTLVRYQTTPLGPPPPYAHVWNSNARPLPPPPPYAHSWNSTAPPAILQDHNNVLVTPQVPSQSLTLPVIGYYLPNSIPGNSVPPNNGPYFYNTPHPNPTTLTNNYSTALHQGKVTGGVLPSQVAHLENRTEDVTSVVRNATYPRMSHNANETYFAGKQSQPSNNVCLDVNITATINQSVSHNLPQSKTNQYWPSLDDEFIQTTLLQDPYGFDHSAATSTTNSSNTIKYASSPKTHSYLYWNGQGSSQEFSASDVRTFAPVRSPTTFEQALRSYNSVEGAVVCEMPNSKYKLRVKNIADLR